LTFWKLNKRRGVWLKVPIEKSVLVAPAVAAGFVFHHAEKDYVMMNHWLSEEENRMPANATHQVGVGCVVINNGKLLMVQEKNGPLRGTGVWKLPTGLSDAGEDLYDAAVREVHEETGIETEFVSILNIRQSHTALFGKSDLFFVCLLRPKTTTINMQPAEISACDWIDSEQYLTQKFFMKSPIFAVVNEQIRKTVQAVANDPKWLITQDTPETAQVSTAEAVQGSEASARRTAGDLPVPSMVVSKLPNGIRPGESVLYHFPLSP
jgi:ADP-ribose pyrophosphatase YjhB (NUDIX family)